ncbi:CD44 molecule (Indian blood group) [Phyllostomus discolor]|uniref:CD44 antigen n=1 Tax=Phyllostomus discolor TaxID=89673 RepID=A0A7E6E1F1_9CHIR|nr:CD44 antigen isoform X19 [Phyllostomus discolor]KAF6102605.1 CD44 molecule (Indian blood group) [Phyllostomus discolor]
MDKIGWRAAWGLCLLHLSLAQIDLNVTCRYSGVFHVEKNGRYSISRTEAADLCAAFNCTLPTMAQMEEARSVGFETCRYGFIEGHVVIPRIHPNSICAANHTGVYILSSNTSQYDTYCFNASAPQGEDCTSITDLPNAFDGPITITIVNRDGTRYTKRGEYRTNPDDINANTTDYDFSSGSPSERSTPTDYTIFHTQLPTEYPTQGGDHPSVPSYPEDASVTNTDSSDSTTPQPPADPDTGLVEDRTESLSVTTQQSHTQSFSTSQGGLEEDKEQPVTPTAAPSTSDDVKGGRTVGNLPEDSTTSAEGVPPHSPDTKEHTTLLPVTPANTGVPTGTEVTTVGDSNVHVDLSLSGDQDSTSDSAGRHHTTHGSKADGHSSGSQGGGASTTSGPIRKPQIPEWLIILASLLALALILAVCIAVNSRRRCGQKKKLVINNGNGAVEDRKPSGLNGEASKSQEMVHLVNKEPSETTDQFMTTDETQNLQNEDVKIGA